MSINDIVYGIEDLFENYLFIPFEHIGNSFNIAIVIVLSFGMLYWLNKQAKFNKQAENDPNQIK